jgi:hypothetical protein
VGDYSELYFTDENSAPQPDTPREPSPYLFSNYHVPLFWLALFEPSNIADASYKDVEGIWPYLITTREEAINRFSNREAFIHANFPSCRLQWVEDFKGMIVQSTFKYLHANTQSVGAMFCSGPEWRAEITEMLNLFDAPPIKKPSNIILRQFFKPKLPAAWKIFNRRFGAAYLGANARESWPYRGNGATDEPTPWAT